MNFEGHDAFKMKDNIMQENNLIDFNATVNRIHDSVARHLHKMAMGTIVEKEQILYNSIWNSVALPLSNALQNSTRNALFETIKESIK